MGNLTRSILLWGSLGAAAAVPFPAAAECISARHDASRIYLTNSCRDYAQWAICVRVSDRSFDDYAYGTTAPMGTSEYGLFLGAGATFSYTVSACKGSGCKPARPQCPAPPAAGGGGADGEANAFKQCYWGKCIPALKAEMAVCQAIQVSVETQARWFNCVQAASLNSTACRDRCLQLAK